MLSSMQDIIFQEFRSIKKCQYFNRDLKEGKNLFFGNKGKKKLIACTDFISQVKQFYKMRA